MEAISHHQCTINNVPPYRLPPVNLETFMDGGYQDHSQALPLLVREVIHHHWHPTCIHLFPQKPASQTSIYTTSPGKCHCQTFSQLTTKDAHHQWNVTTISLPSQPLLPCCMTSPHTQHLFINALLYLLPLNEDVRPHHQCSLCCIHLLCFQEPTNGGPTCKMTKYGLMCSLRWMFPWLTMRDARHQQCATTIFLILSIHGHIQLFDYTKTKDCGPKSHNHPPYHLLLHLANLTQHHHPLTHTTLEFYRMVNPSLPPLSHALCRDTKIAQMRSFHCRTALALLNTHAAQLQLTPVMQGNWGIGRTRQRLEGLMGKIQRRLWLQQRGRSLRCHVPVCTPFSWLPAKEMPPEDSIWCLQEHCHHYQSHSPHQHCCSPRQCCYSPCQ